MNFGQFFRDAASGNEPRPYQVSLAETPWPETLVIPTGFGKTAAVLAAWLWKVSQHDPQTPRRLVYCLPMRTLVEQTERVAQAWIKAAHESLGLEAGLDVLMGGRNEGRRGAPDWMLTPERPTILVGTQDFLVSAALMRGYGATRYRWPVDFALLHNDALWVFDEVQLTGAALPTSAQLEGFRRRFGVSRGCRTLWMSATLDPEWLRTVDFTPRDKRRPHDLEEADLAEAAHLWRATKRLDQLKFDPPGIANIEKREELKAYASELAKLAAKAAKPATNTMIFLNTVARAQAVFDAINSLHLGVDLVLAHSRFRKADRDERLAQLSAPPPAQGRFVVATQALEAGVDVTSSTLITEIAPWSSLIQRFGRSNRYGECGEAGADMFWVDLPQTAAAARPYEASELAAARLILQSLSRCGPSDVASIPPSAPARGSVIRTRDLLDLFDTDPDLSGFDVDVSVYVRDADDTDVRLFWRPVEEDVPPADAAGPAREELCPAPIAGARQLLTRKDDVRAWRWDALIEAWRRVEASELFPGVTLWVDAASGGYDSARGFDPLVKRAVDRVSPSLPQQPESAIDADRDTASKVRVSLAQHSLHVRDESELLSTLLELATVERGVLVEAAPWHDLGKAHVVFKSRCGLASSDPPLAKTPAYDWRRSDPRNRRLFRHEVASALAYLANQQWREDASLVAYLIVAHHGKARMRLRAVPNEQRPAESGRLFARGVFDGDTLPPTDLGAVTVAETRLELDLMQLGEGPCGASWSARTQGLLKEYGPFRLAWLEALLRIADWRASNAEDEAGHDDL